MPNAESEFIRRLSAVEARLDELPATPGAEPERLSLVVFSGELDRLLSAFVLATGAAASGMPVTMFFTFWATAALRRRQSAVKKDLLERVFGWLLPRGTQDLPLSRLNLGGLGPRLMRRVMRQRGVPSLEELMELATELGVELRVCDMSLGLLGLKREELIDLPGMESCGVATFIECAARGRIAMFV
jgi:peroxiredoxin family protein